MLYANLENLQNAGYIKNRFEITNFCILQMLHRKLHFASLVFPNTTLNSSSFFYFQKQCEAENV